MHNLAILSPSTTDKPETFIQSHIDGIGENITYYYGDTVPRYIKGEGLFSMDNKNLGNRQAWKHIISHFNPIKYKRSGLNLKEYMFAESLKSHHIDAVLAEYGTASADVVNSCRYIGIPLIAHFHGRDCSCYDTLKTYGDRYKKLFRYASAVIAVSHAMEKQLVSLGCPMEKLVYAPCTPDDKYFSLNPSLATLQYLFVGRFVDKKAPYITLYAFKTIWNKHPEAKLVMGGNGPLLETCMNLAKIWGIESSVSFPGAITPMQNMQYIMNSRAYVQHSVVAADGDSEGTPVSVMEASAAGLPVISTFHAGIPDVIEDGKTGLLCREKDAEKMAGDMLRVADDVTFASSLGQSGKARMKEYFSKQWQMNVLTDTIEKAINNNKKVMRS